MVSKVQSDKCISFYLENGLIKGHFCRLSQSITDALKNHQYPKEIKVLLAEMAAMSQCFTMDIKSGSCATMQLMGTEPVKLALANSLDSTSFRCCATFSEEGASDFSNLSLPQLFGQQGKLVFTVDFENQHYQTIIELNAKNLQGCFQHYFSQSQQIQTIVLICSHVDDNSAESAAFLLQRMPNTSNSLPDEAQELWHEVSCFTATIKPHELLSTGPAMDKLLNLVFRDLSPVVSRETNLSFRCTCSKGKILNIMRNFAAEDNSAEKHEIICEYCNQKYIVDKSEIAS